MNITEYLMNAVNNLAVSHPESFPTDSPFLDSTRFRKVIDYLLCVADKCVDDERIVYVAASPCGYVAAKEHDLYIKNTDIQKEWLTFWSMTGEKPSLCVAVEIDAIHDAVVYGSCFPIDSREINAYILDTEILMRKAYKMEGVIGEVYTCEDDAALSALQKKLYQNRRTDIADLEQKTQNGCLYCKRDDKGKVQLFKVSMSDSTLVRIGFADSQLGVQVVRGKETEKQVFPVKFCPMCGRKF